MTQVQGIPYRRHGPSAALREFLDPLDPGDYFDCGRARLHGLDDALLEEARSRGRTVGDDAFLLVATDMGLIFCRPSISFAIAARWEDLSLIRPRGSDPVVLPVTWPRHGELKFTISKRLAGNIFRRWLQLRMHVARRARQEQQPSPAGIGPGLDGDLEARAELGPGLDSDDDRAEPADETGSARDADRIGDGEGEATGDGHGVDDLGRVDTVDPTAPSPAETADGFGLFEPLGVDDDRRTMVDDELERVTVPQTATPTPSWVGSAVSVAASLVVISTVVLIVTVSVSLWRGASTGRSVSTSTDVAGPATSPSTIDHERFRASAEPAGRPGPGATGESASLAPSSAGGASQDRPSSSQQLLAVPPGPAGPELGVGLRPEPGVEPDVDPGLAPRCSSHYSGCVPDVTGTAGADVDCVGQGDGPHFVDAEVMVLGDDVYGLDSDGDRVACEADQLDADPLSPEPGPDALGG